MNNSGKQVSVDRVIDAYVEELSRMTQRALVAEAFAEEVGHELALLRAQATPTEASPDPTNAPTGEEG